MNLQIQTKNLALELNGVSILRDISLEVSSGEHVSIIGPNGAGKTSLLRCMLGLHSYQGQVHISGTECRNIHSKKLAQIISYVPQSHNIEFPLPVFDFVMMGRYPYLSPLSPAQPKDTQAVERALDITNTSQFRDRLLHTLSGGERQKVYIAAALAQETPIILLDEPATFLDWKHQTEVMQLLKKINTECGATIIAVHHDLNNAARWSDRMIAIKDGSILFDDTPEKLIQPGPLQELFETPFTHAQTLIPSSEQEQISQNN